MPRSEVEKVAADLLDALYDCECDANPKQFCRVHKSVRILNIKAIEQALTSANAQGYKDAIAEARKVAEEHSCRWEMSCVDEDSEGNAVSNGYCNRVIAEAIGRLGE